MKIKDIVREDADATTSSSGDIAIVDASLFARPIKRTDNRTYGNTPKPVKYTPKTK